MNMTYPEFLRKNRRMRIVKDKSRMNGRLKWMYTEGQFVAEQDKYFGAEGRK
jgi:hypothetical protein